MGKTITLINGDVIYTSEIQRFGWHNYDEKSLIRQVKQFAKAPWREMIKLVTWQLATNHLYELSYRKATAEPHIGSLYFTSTEERDVYYKHLKEL